MINFISRLKELLSLNVEFLLVFDGVMKPSSKGNLTTNRTLLLVMMRKSTIQAGNSMLRIMKFMAIVKDC